MIILGSILLIWFAYLICNRTSHVGYYIAAIFCSFVITLTISLITYTALSDTKWIVTDTIKMNSWKKAEAADGKVYCQFVEESDNKIYQHKWHFTGIKKDESISSPVFVTSKTELVDNWYTQMFSMSFIGIRFDLRESANVYYEIQTPSKYVDDFLVK